MISTNQIKRRMMLFGGLSIAILVATGVIGVRVIAWANAQLRRAGVLSQALLKHGEIDMLHRIGLQEEAPFSPFLYKLAEFDRAEPGLGLRIGALFLEDACDRLDELALALKLSDAEIATGFAPVIRGSGANVGAGEIATASALPSPKPVDRSPSYFRSSALNPTPTGCVRPS